MKSSGNRRVQSSALSIRQVAKHRGVAAWALPYYEAGGWIHSRRNPAGQRPPLP